MEHYNWNQCNISAFGIILSIIGGLLMLMGINAILGTTLAEAPMFLIILTWTACAGILAFVCEHIGL